MVESDNRYSYFCSSKLSLIARVSVAFIKCITIACASWLKCARALLENTEYIHYHLLHLEVGEWAKYVGMNVVGYDPVLSEEVSLSCCIGIFSVMRVVVNKQNLIENMKKNNSCLTLLRYLNQLALNGWILAICGAFATLLQSTHLSQMIQEE